MCDEAGFFTPYDSLTNRTRYMCKEHYKEWSASESPHKFKLSAEQRMRARLARAELDVNSEPTELQRMVEDEEIREEEEKIAPALRAMYEKFKHD